MLLLLYFLLLLYIYIYIYYKCPYLIIKQNIVQNIKYLLNQIFNNKLNIKILKLNIFNDNKQANKVHNFKYLQFIHLVKLI